VIVWAVLVLAVGASLPTRRSLDVLVLRQPGTLFATLLDDEVANFYTVQAFNRTAASLPFDLSVVEPRGARVTLLGPLDSVAPHAMLESRLLVSLPASELRGASTPITFEVRIPGTAPQRSRSSFVGPVDRREHERGSGRPDHDDQRHDKTGDARR
jgi:hypothetical protein